MPYKQIFGQTYPAASMENTPANALFAVSAAGQLSINSGQAEDTASLVEIADVSDITDHAAITSSQVLIPGSPHQRAETADERYHVITETIFHDGNTEYWLVHTDRATGKVKRVKLYTQGEPKAGRPRVMVSPASRLFVADDGGTIRLYSADQMADMGAFQIAHNNTENHVIALAVNLDERLIAGLSSWKDIVVYDAQQKRIVFVRKITDSVGWYASAPAHIALVGKAEVIAVAGVGQDSEGQPVLSVSVFRQVAALFKSRTAPGLPDSSSR